MTNETTPTPETAPAGEGSAFEPSPVLAEPSLLAMAAEEHAGEGALAAEPQAATPQVAEPHAAKPQAAELPPYEPFKLPEGAALAPEELAHAIELFRASALDQQQAQKFIDLAVSREQAAAAKGQQAFAELQNRWVSEIKADPDIGGERLQASLASASRAIDRLGVPGLREALNLTGAGNHPAVVKAFVRLGQMVAEDRFLPGKDAAPAAPRTLAEVIYGNAFAD